MQIISASIEGISHRQLHYNNQDAYKVKQEADFIVGVVCDGCGSHTDSEIGAKLTAEFVTNFCLTHFQHEKFDGQKLANALTQFYVDCAKMVHAIYPNEFIRDTFFTTIIGFIISDGQNLVFSAGDGVILIDDKLLIINQQNMPNYLTHNLLNGKKYGFEVRAIENRNFQRLLISTDGISDLWEKETQEKVIDTLFSDNMFRSEIELSKFLAESTIYDDTTMILVRK